MTTPPSGHVLIAPDKFKGSLSAFQVAELAEAGIAAAYALSDIEPDTGRCLADAAGLVEETAVRIAADWLS
jgi:glycerate kinase